MDTIPVMLRSGYIALDSSVQGEVELFFLFLILGMVYWRGQSELEPFFVTYALVYSTGYHSDKARFETF